MPRNCLILMSSFNGEKYIGEQIQSIFYQTGLDSVCLLIRDDGSKDDTKKIVKQFIEKGFNIKLIEGTNIGYVASFLKLVDSAYEEFNDYDYFLFSDQDDVWQKDKIESAVRRFEGQEDLLLYCSSSLAVDEKLSPLKYKKKSFSIEPYSSIIQTFSAGHTYVFTRRLLNLIKYSDPTKIYTHDGFVFSLACLTGVVVFDNTPHVLYRQYSNNQLGTSNKNPFKYFSERIRRMKRGDFKKYGRQIRYIFDAYQDVIGEDYREELRKFITSQKSFFKRFHYLLKSKVHRQTFFDNLLFKTAYLFGQYNN